MPVNRPVTVYLRVILLHCTACLATAATLPLAATLSNATIPPGGTAQLQFFLAVNKTITSGTATITLDPAIFDNITAADVYSATGDQTGAANIQGHQVAVNFQSLTGGIGRLPALPVLTVTVPVLSTAKPGASSTPTFTATFTDGTGQQYTATLSSGSLTVGGTLSVQNVQPLGTILPAGTTVTITGTGFAATTTVQIDGLALAAPQFVNAAT
jgi:IPT/TIG domain